MTNKQRIKHIFIAVRFSWLRAVAELRSEATRTFAGFFWWILSPAISFVIYYIAFSLLMKQQQDFIQFLFIGLVCWQWFSSSILRGANSINSSSGLGNLIYVHKSLFPLTGIFVDTVKFLFSLLPVIVMLLYYGCFPTSAWFSLIPLFLVFFLFIIGCTLICAALIPFCPDFYLILSNAITGLMFLSGVVFDLSHLDYNSIPGRLYSYNPIADFLREIRRVLITGAWPAWSELISIGVIGIAFTFIGLGLICIWDRHYPKIS